MEDLLESEKRLETSCQKMPTRKFNIVIVGDQTRLAFKILPAQQVEGIKQSFIVHEQATPSNPSSHTFFNNFISTNGDKLEACLKVTECPPDTMTVMAKESYLKSVLTDFLDQADLVLVSVPKDDKADY